MITIDLRVWRICPVWKKCRPVWRPSARVDELRGESDRLTVVDHVDLN